MNIKTTKTKSNCIWCGCGNTGFRYTCRDCTKLLPKRFYGSKFFSKVVPNHIPEEQKIEFGTRRIIKYLEGVV